MPNTHTKTPRTRSLYIPLPTHIRKPGRWYSCSYIHTNKCNSSRAIRTIAIKCQCVCACLCVRICDASSISASLLLYTERTIINQLAKQQQQRAKQQNQRQAAQHLHIDPFTLLAHKQSITHARWHAVVVGRA